MKYFRIEKITMIFQRSLLIFFIYALFTGCSDSSDSDDSPFNLALTKKTYWVSDSELIFLARKSSMEKDIGHSHLYSLHYPSLQTRLIHKNVRHFCISSNHALLSTDEGEKLIDIEKNFDRFTLVNSKDVNPDLILSYCHLIPRDKYRGPSKDWPLPEFNGYLSAIENEDTEYKKNARVAYTQSNSKKILPIRRNEIVNLFYSATNDSYFIERGYQPNLKRVSRLFPWPENIPRTSWWLARDGTLTTYNWPEKRKSSSYVNWVKRGMLVVDDLGLYVVSKNTEEKLLDGRFTTPSVSPDGCLISGHHLIQKHNSNSKKFKLKIINLCNKDAK